MSIIDSISAGLAATSKRAWLLIVPILVDLFLWKGPQLSVAPLLERVARALADARSEIVTMPNVDSATIENLNYLISSVRKLSTSENGSLNLAVLIETFAVRVPTLMVTQSPQEAIGNRIVIGISSQKAFWGAFMLLLFIGSAIAALYLTLAAQGIRQDDPPKPFLSQLRRNWGYMTLLEVLLLTLVTIIGLPATLIFMIIGAAIPVLVPSVISLMIMTLIWLGIYAAFTLEAMFVSDANLLQALWYSLNVVHRNFWSTVGLLILVNVIRLGLTVIWRAIGVNTTGALVSIVGSAYVGSGLVVASFIFYQDRFARWQEEKQAKAQE